jgi:hypothetical protein
MTEQWRSTVGRIKAISLGPSLTPRVPYLQFHDISPAGRRSRRGMLRSIAATAPLSSVGADHALVRV